MIEALDLPQDLAAAHAIILADREARLALERVQAGERLLIEKLRLEIARLRRQAFGNSSKWGRKLKQLGIEAVIERKQRMAPEDDDDGFLLH
ncbi:hypothetical protein [Azorhizobium sp. AG788]|uniref:hypothetical protein n=1 Tax=Azorhizobium sp. AG788 TaxID=2183897 RepID=UPI001FE1B3F1|nr:hypothetical protein [Azorhizobium sp. AG788]